MQDVQKNSEVVEMAGVLVVNTSHEGYRRAGFTLALGENILPPVSYEKWRMLESDPRLVVSVIASESIEDSETQGAVDDNQLSGEVGPDGIINTPMPPDLKQSDGDLTDPKDNFISAIMASKIDPVEKWFTQKGEPRLDQWRAVVGAQVSAADIKAALAAHGAERNSSEAQ